MAYLSRAFRQAHKSGVYVYARVEETHFGFATIKLGSNRAGPRLSNLAVLGGAVSENQLVIVDYASGIPKVRPLAQAYVEQEEIIELAQFVPEQETVDPPGPHVLYVYGDQQQTVNQNGTIIDFTNAKFDSGSLFTAGQIKLPQDGFYFFLAHVLVTGFPDNTGMLQWDPVNYNMLVTRVSLNAFNLANSKCFAELFIKSNKQGVFGYGAAYTVDTGVTYPTHLEAFGYLNGRKDEVITVEAVSNFGTLTSQVDAGLYPRIMGHRMNRDGPFSQQEAEAQNISEEEQFPVIDDSDIELDGNKGYLHVSDTIGAHARAIAHASDVSDAELLVKFQFDDIADGGQLKFWLRASRNWYDWDKPAHGYEISISSAGNWFLAKVENGARTILISLNRAASGLQHYLRFQTNGNDIKAKIWLTTDTEPGWQIQTTDATSLGAGTLQIGLFRQSGEHWARIDDVNLHVP